MSNNEDQPRQREEQPAQVDDSQPVEDKANRSADDAIVSGGEASGGGTPLGGSQNTHEPGLSGITGSAEGNSLASRAFGGSTTGYGEDAETESGSGFTEAGGGTAGGMATGTKSGSGGTAGGQSTGGSSGLADTGMVVGGGTEGKVNLIDPDELNLQPDDDDSPPTPNDKAKPR